MTKRLIAFALILLSALAPPGDVVAHAATDPAADHATLTGTVYDEGLEPVRAAEVAIDGAGKAFTDLKGYFELERVPFGTHRVVVRAPGFLPDATDISIVRRHEEFTTTLARRDAPGREAGLENRPALPPLPHPTLHGLSGRIMLPDTQVLPGRAFAVGYSLGRAGHPIPRLRQRVSHLSLTAGLPEKLEVSVTAQEVSRSLLGEFPFTKATAFGVKRRLTPFRVGDAEVRWAVGGRDFSGRDGEVFVVLDFPFLETHRLAAIPTWHSDTGNHVVHVSYENTLSRRGERSATLLLEALQSDFDLPGFESGFDYYNAAVRYAFARDRAAQIYWHHDAVTKFRMVGVGASMAFE